MCFSPAGGVGPSVSFLFEPFALVLVFEFILHVRKRISINITVPQLVNCSGTGKNIIIKMFSLVWFIVRCLSPQRLLMKFELKKGYI